MYVCEGGYSYPGGFFVHKGISDEENDQQTSQAASQPQRRMIFVTITIFIIIIPTGASRPLPLQPQFHKSSKTQEMHTI